MIRANRQVIRLSVTAQACLLLLVAGSAAAASYRYDRYVPTLKVTEPSTEGGAGSGGSTNPGSGGGASAPTDGSGNAGGTGGNSDGGSGGGGTASPSFFLSTNALDFGSLNRNQTSSSQSLLVTNDSSVGLTGLTLLSGVNFPATTDCTSTLAAGASCQVSIQFSPSVSEAALTDYLSVAASGLGAQKVTLTGMVRSPVLKWVGPETDFGTVLVKTPASKTYTLQNTGSLNASGLELDKGASTELELTSGTCIGLSALPAGQSCTVTATLTPLTSGARSGTLKASANLADTKSIGWSASTPRSTQTVNGSLSGTSYNFGNVVEGSPDTKAFTVTAGAESGVTGLYVTLPANQPLSLAANSCGTLNSKVTLAANTSCSFTVRYGDSTASTMSGAEIVVTSNAENSPTKISVSGKTVYAAASGIVERFATFPNLSYSSAEAINGPSYADYTIQRTGNIVTYNGAGAYSTSQVVTWSASSPIWPISANVFLQRTSGGMSVIQYVGSARTVLNSQTMTNFTTGGIAYDSATGYYYVLSGGNTTAGPALARFTVNNNTIGNLTLLGNNQDGRAMILSGSPVVMGPDGWLYATRAGTVYRFSTDGSAYQAVSTLAPPSGYTQPSNSWGSEAAGIVFDRQGNALRMFNNQILSYPALGNGQYGTPTAIAGQFNTSGTTNGTGSVARLNTNAVFRQAPDGTGFVISPGQVQRVR